MDHQKKIRILNFSTHDEDCGIGKYQEDFVRQLKANPYVESVFYPTSPNVVKTLTGRALADELRRFREHLEGYDILHIQHEFGFFRGDGEGLEDIINIALRLKKKIVITIHTAPSLVWHAEVRGGSSPRAIAGYYRRKHRNRQTMHKRLAPMRAADKIITLNPHTSQELVSIVGIDPQKLHQTAIPVDLNDTDKFDKTLLRRTMGAQAGDTLLATVGFLSDKKGTDAAIKSLEFLPSEYKLAVLGGINPASGRPEVYDRMTDLIIELGLQDRVYISGYISDDRQLDELVAGADVALYPYDPAYYRLASSAAVNTAINNETPVVAYPAESFLEINRNVEGAISITQSPNYYEMSRLVKTVDFHGQLTNAAKYATKNSLAKIADELVELYKSLI